MPVRAVVIELIKPLIIALIVAPSLIWFIGIVRWRFRTKLKPCTGDLPRVSVIVAGRNEADHIAECLLSLLNLDYPSDRLEVLFVDDHSNDLTHEIASRIAAGNPRCLTLLSAPDKPAEMGSKKRALTYAIAQSAGDILLFCDADNRVSPRWARSVISLFDERTGAVAGAAIPTARETAGLKLYRLERLMVALTSASAIGLGKPGTACGQNLALRKAALQAIGGYAFPNLPSGDDDLTVQAISRSGWKVRFADIPASVVRDVRTPSLAAHSNATVRHQSVTHLYPTGLRALYAASILSGILLIGITISIFLSNALLPVLLLSLTAKAILDFSSVTLFNNRLKIRLSVMEKLIAEVLLPIYLVLRPLFRLRSKFVWRGAEIKRSANTITGSAR